MTKLDNFEVLIRLTQHQSLNLTGSMDSLTLVHSRSQSTHLSISWKTSGSASSILTEIIFLYLESPMSGPKNIALNTSLSCAKTILWAVNVTFPSPFPWTSKITSVSAACALARESWSHCFLAFGSSVWPTNGLNLPPIMLTALSCDVTLAFADAILKFSELLLRLVGLAVVEVLSF